MPDFLDRLFAESDNPPAWAIPMVQDIHTIKHVVRAIQERVDHMDHNMDDVLSNLAAERSQTGALIALFRDVKDKLSAALSTVALPADVQQKINAAFDAVEANKSDIMNSINVNTPAAAVNPDAQGAPAPVA